MKRATNTSTVALPNFPFFRNSLCAGFVAATIGCSSPGTVVVDYAIDVSVAGRDETGRAWRAAAKDIATLPRDPRRASAFPDVRYSGKDFEWAFGMGTMVYGGSIRNLNARQLCIHFEQARLTSNFQTGEIPMHALVRPRVMNGKVILPPQYKKGEKQYVVPAPLCILPGKTEFFFNSPDVSELFPNGSLFNVSRRDNDIALSEKGIGNWIKLKVPIDYEGKYGELEVTLTLTDAETRISYY